MKNYLIILLLIGIVFSCEQSEAPTENFEQSQLDNVLKLRGQVQRDAYILLDSPLKYKVWVNKLTNVKTTLNEEQIKVVNNLLDILSPDFFEKNNENNTKYVSKIEDWLLSSKKVFNKHQFLSTFVSINYSRDIGDPDPIDEEGCSCNHSEDYCWFSDCTGSKCEDTYTGCGLLWNSSCNGTCED
ncbi:MAG: bacteriocin fulvocin C-related protein [Gelidibacter sp.]